MQVSIIVPVYNVERHLRQCLDSLRAQTLRDIEFVCVDDGSTDGSLGILREYEAADGRFRVVSQENTGPGPARNVGLDMACGEYIMLLDSDDLFSPLLVERMLNRAQATSADVVVCASDELDDRTGRVGANPWALRVEYVPSEEPFAPTDTKGCLFHIFKGWPWDKLYRRLYLEEQGLRFPNMTNSEDLLFVYGALAHAERIAVVREPLVAHRIGRKGSVSNSRLRDPECFYRGIEALQVDLQKDSRLYGSLEWGFLNWAADYAVWNIATLKKGSPERSLLVERFATGGYPALELDSHVPEFYALCPETPDGIRALYAEYEGRSLPRRTPKGIVRDIVRAFVPAHPLDR